MRPVTVRQGAVGFSDWVVIDRFTPAASIGLGAKISNGAVLTYKVEHTFDDIFQQYVCSIARALTVATLTEQGAPALPLSAADWVKIVNSGSSNLDGQYDVATVPTASTLTYTVVDTGAAASGPLTVYQRARCFDHATMVALSASANGNYAFPPFACRLKVTAWTSGFVDLTVIQQGALG